MPKNLAIFGLLVALMAGCGGGADAPQVATEEGVTVLSGARLIDGNGGAPVENAVLVIRGDRFEAVGAEGSVEIPEGAEVIDLSGKTIMPPLITLHSHLALTSNGLDNNEANFNEENIRNKLNQFARYGVLHVTSMGTDRPLVYEIRDRQRAGDFPGARIYTAGRGFGVPAGGYPPLQPGADENTDVNRLQSPEEARAAVADLAEHDVDFVKMWVDHHFNTLPEFSPEIYQADRLRSPGAGPPSRGAHPHLRQRGPASGCGRRGHHPQRAGSSRGRGAHREVPGERRILGVDAGA
jgi:hypothetical protein